MVKQYRAYIDTPEPQKQIHARCAGDKGAHVVMLHQVPLSCRQYERVLPLMGDFCRATGLDMPGYGSSLAPPGPLPFAEYARRMVQAIDARGIDRFVLVGLEIGVALAAEFYRQIGDRVTHVLLMGVPPLGGADKQRYMDDIGTPAPVTEDGDYVLPLWNRYTRRWGKDAENAMLRMAFTETHNIYDRYDWAVQSFAAYDMEPGLRAITCPTLILSAEFDELLPHDKAAAGLIPQAQHVVLPGTHPGLVTTEARQVTDRLRDFIGAGAV